MFIVQNFYQAIQTRYLGPTNRSGARVKAFAKAGSYIVPWDHSADTDANHYQAAQALVSKLGWVAPNYGPIVGGVLPNGDYAFVMLPVA